MSQILILLKRKPTTTATTDGGDLIEADSLNKATAADSLASLKKALEESEKFRDDFLKTLAEAECRVRAVRRISDKGWLNYEEETKLTDEQKTERAVIRRKIEANLNVRKLAETCCW